MSEAPDDPVELYRASGLPEAHALRILLESEGIPVRIDNELLQGVVGELPMGWSTAPRLFVNRMHEVAARIIVKDHLDRLAASKNDSEQPLRCLACGIAMGEADACAACGWSYGSEPDESSEPLAPAPVDRDDSAERLARELACASPLSRRELWLEVCAVLAVGVIPNLVGAIASLNQPPGTPQAYWLDTFQLTITSACTIFVTVYLIHRSGEPQSRFGLGPLSGWDVPLTLLLLILTESIWNAMASAIVHMRFVEETPAFFAHPKSLAEYAMMVLKYLVAAFAEEIVTRGYLIARLKVLLRSPSQAVLVAALLFASYHSYQGVIGTAYAFAFGLAFGVAFLLIGRVWPLAFAHALYDMRIDLMAG